ncbi:MAG: pyridoxamine 5'-phosphate oxidase family protein [Pseudonocardia sediminis]
MTDSPRTDAPRNDALTADDLEFLRRPLFGFLSVAGGPDPAQPRPVWFEATDEGTVQLFTDPASPKVRRLRRDPRASIIAATPVGERERWVSVTGRVTIESDGADDLLARLFARYWDDLDDPARSEELAGMLAADWVRIVIHPEKVRRFAN